MEQTGPWSDGYWPASHRCPQCLFSSIIRQLLTLEFCVRQDLTVPTRDMVFHHQLYGANFESLEPDTLLAAKVVGKPLCLCPLVIAPDETTETKQYANSCFKSCQKLGIIREDGKPDTTKIGSDLVNKIAIISTPKCRELVNLLFFWEEESTRWRLLCNEERELERTVQDGDTSEDERIHLYEALKIVAARKRILPSLRDESGELLPGHEALPDYRP